MAESEEEEEAESSPFLSRPLSEMTQEEVEEEEVEMGRPRELDLGLEDYFMSGANGAGLGFGDEEEEEEEEFDFRSAFFEQTNMGKEEQRTISASTPRLTTRQHARHHAPSPQVQPSPSLRQEWIDAMRLVRSLRPVAEGVAAWEEGTTGI